MQNDPFSCRVGHILSFERNHLARVEQVGGDLSPSPDVSVTKKPASFR